MARSQLRSKRKPTGGAYKGKMKKKQHELGREPALTRIGERKLASTRVAGANVKSRLLRDEKINLFDPKSKKYVKATLKRVVENPANRHYARRNILTKGSIVETDKGNARITSRPGQTGSVDGVLV